MSNHQQCFVYCCSMMVFWNLQHSYIARSALLLDGLCVDRDVSGGPPARRASAAAEAHRRAHAHREPERAAPRPQDRSRSGHSAQRKCSFTLRLLLTSDRLRGFRFVVLLLLISPLSPLFPSVLIPSVLRIRSGVQVCPVLRYFSGLICFAFYR